MKAPILKPCPFCGMVDPTSRDFIDFYPMRLPGSIKEPEFYVGCICGAQAIARPDRKKAAEEWNKRTEPIE
jgi:Lar family restriction alleviation protein